MLIVRKGLKGIKMSAAYTSAGSPRPLVTNMGTTECLGDLAVDVDFLKVGTTKEIYQHLSMGSLSDGRRVKSNPQLWKLPQNVK